MAEVRRIGAGDCEITLTEGLTQGAPPHTPPPGQSITVPRNAGVLVDLLDGVRDVLHQLLFSYCSAGQAGGSCNGPFFFFFLFLFLFSSFPLKRECRRGGVVSYEPTIFWEGTEKPH